MVVWSIFGRYDVRLVFFRIIRASQMIQMSARVANIEIPRSENSCTSNPKLSREKWESM